MDIFLIVGVVSLLVALIILPEYITCVRKKRDIEETVINCLQLHTNANAEFIFKRLEHKKIHISLWVFRVFLAKLAHQGKIARTHSYTAPESSPYLPNAFCLPSTSNNGQLFHKK